MLLRITILEGLPKSHKSTQENYRNSDLRGHLSKKFDFAVYKQSSEPLKVFTLNRSSISTSNNCLEFSCKSKHYGNKSFIRLSILSEISKFCMNYVQRASKISIFHSFTVSIYSIAMPPPADGTTRTFNV